MRAGGWEAEFCRAVESHPDKAACTDRLILAFSTVHARIAYTNTVSIFAWENSMKNITLSADEGLIEEARRRAATENTTLNAVFRQWLADYVGRKRKAERALETLRELSATIDTGGRKFTREEMNERR